MSVSKVHIEFPGRVVFIGFGSIGQGTLPLVLRHIGVPKERITIVTSDDRGKKVAEEYGIKVVKVTLTRDNYGRDHHPRNFCMWLAGGGIKGGMTYGETDDFSYNIVDKPCHLNDLYATVLKCMGIDHERLTFRFQGLDQKLTGVEGAQVIPELMA